LAEDVPKCGHLNGIEIIELPQYSLKEGTPRLRESGMLDWIYQVRSAYPSCKDSGQTF
jgi:hypothetical protein